MNKKHAAADVAMVALVCCLGYVWASWVDPMHRAHDQARAYWHGFRFLWKVSSVTAQLALHCEHKYRKVTTS